MKKFIQHIKEFWKSPYRWPVLVVILIVFITGLSMGGGNPNTTDTSAQNHNHLQEIQPPVQKEQIWTCSMHPQIRQHKPGKCPICFMDLVPVESHSTEVANPRQLKLTETAMKLADIQTAPVVRSHGAAEVRMVGKVFYDETRLVNITARVPGRIDRLYIDFTGTSVRKGDQLVSLYSPELVTAQQELLQAIKSYKKYGTGQSLVEAAREKLKLWGLTPKQIQQIETKDEPNNHLTIYAPSSGIVIQKNAIDGSYVQTGSLLYAIADLSHVWVKLDAYESDLSWIHTGQMVKFETEAYPGDMFTGKIAFIDPVLDPQTRTVRVRVNVDNPQLKLKPEMFVRAIVQSDLATNGTVSEQASPDQTGHWEPSLLIPASAPLLTGTRAVVYTSVPGKEGTFEGKEIVLGPRSGDYYVVKQGLQEGETVVVNGAFKIDSDLQIQAKPSMMNPSEESRTPVHQHESPSPEKNTLQPPMQHKKAEKPSIPIEFKKSIDSLANAYFQIQHALSSDDLADSQKAGTTFLNLLSTVDMELLSGHTHMEWMKQLMMLKDAGQKLTEAKDIESARVQFERLTDPMTATIKTFSSGSAPVYRFHCPMAFNNKGAYWLQNSDETRNPYFGASMLLCKDSVETLDIKKTNEKK